MRFWGALAGLVILTAGCAPGFQVGDCVTSRLAAERWEQPVISQVLEIGRRSYRVRHWLHEHHSWGTNHWSKDFLAAWFHTTIACPEASK